MGKYNLEEVQQKFINVDLIPLFDEYINNQEKLLAQTSEGYLVVTNLNRIKNGVLPEIFHKSNLYTIHNIIIWCKLNNKLFELLDGQEYKNNNKKLKWRCLKEDCGEIFEMNWNDIHSGHSCPYCSGKIVCLSNCLAIKRPDLIKYLKFKEDGYKYTPYSKQRIDFKCPNCGMIIYNRRIQDITNYGFSCHRCSDGVSYPEKFIFNLLEQLNLDFTYQLSKTNFKWCNNFKYDFYIQILNCIVETHGIQHYEESFNKIKSKKHIRTLIEEQQNDNIKLKLALDNEIKIYIIIDCRHSDLEYIKNSIMQSELPQLLNFKEENIDWLKCHESSCNSLVKVVCDMWNSGINNTKEISNITKISRGTIIKYLKQGKELNWCKYNPKEEVVKKIICITTGEIFNSMKEAVLKYNIRASSLSTHCKDNRKLKSAGRHPITKEKLIWMYYKDYLKNNNINNS